MTLEVNRSSLVQESPKSCNSRFLHHLSKMGAAVLGIFLASNPMRADITSSVALSNRTIAQRTEQAITDVPFVEETQATLVASSFEMQFHQQALTIDLTEKPDFASYLVPNEARPEKVAPLLLSAGTGRMVSAGTERSFFNLALSNPQKCTGLVVRDINPEVKAYVDFNVLLLRISQNREEYAKLSAVYKENGSNNPLVLITDQELSEKLREIRNILVHNSDFPADLKTYYLNHLEEFGEIYFKSRMNVSGDNTSDWQQLEEFTAVHYHKDDALFEQLQTYAKSGSIIATVGDISDLQFLDAEKIAVVDISNIPCYTFLNFTTRSNPLIIATDMETIPSLSTQIMCETTYNGFVFHPLRDETQVQELEALISVLATMSEWTNELVPNDIPPFYSEELLEHLKNYRDDFLVLIEDQWINCDYPNRADLVHWMNNTVDSSLEVNFNGVDVQKLAKFLVKTWKDVNPETYFTFSALLGWAEAFTAEKERSLNDPEFAKLIDMWEILQAEESN